MITTRRRSLSSATIPKSSVEQAALTLEQLPEKPKDAWSLREAIESMQDVITAALSKGYSHDEVAAMLTDRGVEVSPSSLKYYLSRLSKTKSDFAEPKVRRPRKNKRRNASLGQADESSETDQDELSVGDRPASDFTRAPSEDDQPETSTGSADTEDTSAETNTPARNGRRRSNRAAKSTDKTETKSKSKTAAKTRTASKAPSARGGRRKKEAT